MFLLARIQYWVRALSETVCRSNASATNTLKGHGPISRSWIFLPLFLASGRLSSLNVFFYSLTRRCAEHTHDSVTHSQVKVMEFTRHFCVRSIASEPFERFSLNFTQLFLSVRRCVEPMNQLRSLKVKPEGDTSMLLGFCSGGFRCLQTAVFKLCSYCQKYRGKSKHLKSQGLVSGY